jgi:hypothetical protein
MAGRAARIVNRSADVRSPSPAARRPSGAPPAVRTVGEQADQPHGCCHSVSKINSPASTPMTAPRSFAAWTQEQPNGLADTHRDSTVLSQTKMGRKSVRISLPESQNARFKIQAPGGATWISAKPAISHKRNTSHIRRINAHPTRIGHEGRGPPQRPSRRR